MLLVSGGTNPTLSILAALSTLLPLGFARDKQEPAPKGPTDWRVEVVAKYPSVLCFAP